MTFWDIETGCVESKRLIYGQIIVNDCWNGRKFHFSFLNRYRDDEPVHYDWLNILNVGMVGIFSDSPHRDVRF